MFQDIRQLSVLNKIFNVKGNEWSRIGLTWFISLLYRIGFVVGWTVIVAMYVSKYGISDLPYLFIMNAVLMIIGSLIYSVLIDKFKPVNILVSTAFVSAFVLFAAYYFSYNITLFFAFLLVAEALFLVQFRIRLYGFIESMFTPIQSERTFPLIESAETIGGILAGLLVFFISNSIDTSVFILIWIILTLLMVPFVFVCEFLNKKVISASTVKVNEEQSYMGVFSKLKSELFKSKHLIYIKGIFLIIFFQWMLFNLLEFQYTQAVFQNVSNVIFEAGSGFEHAFVHDLGGLFILFSSSALIIQLFVGSRLINGLGVIGSMLLHPLVTLLSLFGLTLSFNFRNAIIAKNNFTVTTVIHTNAYHSGYYAIKENLREHIRGFLDGIVRPVGAVLGTFLIILLQRFFVSDSLIFAINILMIFIAFVLLFVTFLQQTNYTQVALEDLAHSNDKEVRSNAIDILSQKGHSFSLAVLTGILLNENEPVSLRVEVLRAFSEIQDLTVVDSVLEALSSSRASIRKAAVETLLSFGSLSKNLAENLVVDHKIIIKLQNAYKVETSEEIKSKILILLSTLSTVATFEFLMKILKRSKGKLKADVIYALGNYKDPAVSTYLRPYLDVPNDAQRISALIALGRFKEYKKESFGVIQKLLNSQSKKDILGGLFASGELLIKANKSFCLKYLNSPNLEFRIQSAIALAKMGFDDSIPVLIDLLFGQNKVVSLKVKQLFQNVDVRILKNLDKIIRHLVSREVEKLVNKNGHLPLNKMKKHDLVTLKWLYSLIEEYDEIESIEKILKI